MTNNKNKPQRQSYQIVIDEEQRELISRALNHMYEADIEFHEDLAKDIEGEEKLVLTEKGKVLLFLYNTFHCDNVNTDKGLTMGNIMHGLCL